MSIYEMQLAALDKRMHPDINFDTVRKELLFGGKVKCVYYYVNGFGNGELTEKIIEYILENRQALEYLGQDDNKFINSAIPFAEVSPKCSVDECACSIMSGCSALIVDGFAGYIVIDTRNYPKRSIEEPQKDRVLRGAHDGFVEALVPNSALIRRRIRSSELIFRKVTLGSASGTDLLVCYMDDRADHDFVSKIMEKLDKIDVDALSMGQETLIELLLGKRVWNPFPRVRFSERPDSAAAMLLEGSVIILCDNYPSAMILPTSFFTFLQDTDDFYFPPLIGGYLKFIRLSIYFFSLMLMPIWFLLVSNPQYVPETLSFILIKEEAMIPLILQLLLTDIVIDGLKIASLNTPDTLTNSLSIIGGLLLGDIAVQVGWLCPEVIFYMSFVAIANFTQTSYELGYAFKLLRLLTLVLINFFNLYGLIAGVLITVVLIATVPTLEGSKGYLYPLIPFNARALFRLLFRAKAGKKS